MRSRSAPPALRKFGFACMAVFGGLLFVLTLREYFVGRALMGDGQLTNGVMIGRAGGIGRVFAYTFAVPGADGRSHTFAGEVSVSGREYNRALRAKTVTVRYLTRDPNVSRVIDFWSPFPLGFAVGCCGGGGLLVVVGVRGWRDVARATRR
ncbi:MAG TPA: DUF3592 domain-containing protein [Herpetosiphonaceae bacterium]